MIGIVSIGAYIPVYRLSQNEIAKMWGSRAMGGEKAVAGYDEDSVTMGMAAALDCIKRSKTTSAGLYFATTTAPYKEKQSAAIIASAIDLGNECQTADFTNSLRASSTAIKSALDAMKSDSVENVVVTAADCRTGAARGMLEQVLGDGAAAVMLGSKDVIATFEGSYSIYSEFTDLWRLQDDTFIRTTDGRFIDEVGYAPTMQEAMQGIMKKYNLTVKDFARVVYYAADARQHAALARRLGFDKAQVQNPLYDSIGNTGTPAALLMLAVAIEEASPGERILFATYGDGADAFIFRTTEAVSKITNKSAVKKLLARKIPISYGQYLNWRNMVPVEASTLPERSALSLPNRWRERKTISALYGVKCKHCGTPQISQLGQAIRVCVACQTKDQFEEYKFSDKIGKVFSFAIDNLQPTLNSPGINGVIDFDEGGRLICEFTDCAADEIKVGTPMEMTFRKMLHSKGINNYFWKAMPIRD